MTREDAKKLVPIMQAYAEGKTIQYQTGDGMWMNMCNVVAFSDIADHYRIKPEPKYRPFENRDECYKTMLNHEPFGWVIEKLNSKRFNINSIGVSGVGGYTYKQAFKELNFADGTPFGIKE